jgi:hypothetical protein
MGGPLLSNGRARSRPHHTQTPGRRFRFDIALSPFVNIAQRLMLIEDGELKTAASGVNAEIGRSLHRAAPA